MVSAISSVSPSTSFSSAILSSPVNTSSAATASTSDQEALLEAELAIYTQQLAEVSSGTDSSAPGALSAQQLQQQIASIQQQLNQLGATSSTSAASTSAIGNLINTFA
jgi:hypothetical protein